MPIPVFTVFPWISSPASPPICSCSARYTGVTPYGGCTAPDRSSDRNYIGERPIFWLYVGGSTPYTPAFGVDLAGFDA